MIHPWYIHDTSMIHRKNSQIPDLRFVHRAPWGIGSTACLRGFWVYGWSWLHHVTPPKNNPGNDFNEEKPNAIVTYENQPWLEGQIPGIGIYPLSPCWSFFAQKPNRQWLVVSTPLKNVSQLGCLFPIYGKQHVPNHQPDMIGMDIHKLPS